jgi:hypothetical protein
LGGKHTFRREHRTEVTEVTEGDFRGDSASGLWVVLIALGAKHTRRREHRTEVTEVTEGDFRGDSASGLWVVLVAFGRETHAPERASHRGHGGHRGGF